MLDLSFISVWTTPIRCTTAYRRQTATNYNGYKHAGSRGHANKKRETTSRLSSSGFTGFRFANASTTRFLLACKIKQSGEPEQLGDLLTAYVPTRNLRSAEGKNLVILQTKLVISSHAFSVRHPAFETHDHLT